MDDVKFLTHIIAEICDYAVKNSMKPNDTLFAVADDIIRLLKVTTFNKWEAKQNETD